MRLWDLGTGQEVRTLRGHGHIVIGVAFSPDSKRIASGGYDQTVRVWNASTGLEVFAFRGHQAAVTLVAFSRYGRRLASAGMDEVVKVWDAVQGPVPRVGLWIKGSGNILDMAFTADGFRAAVTFPDTSLQVLDPQSSKALSIGPTGHTAFKSAADFSPDGRRVASSGGDGTVRLWDAATGRVQLTFRRVRPSVALGPSFQWSPDGKHFALQVSAQAVKVHDAMTGEERFAIPGPFREDVHMAFSPDGKQLALGTNPATIHDATDGRKILTLPRQSGEPMALAFSPDGQRLACANMEGRVEIHDLAAGRLALTLHGHTAPVLPVAFHPGGRRLASASQDKTVKVWDLKTGQEAITLRGRTNLVYCAAWSLDGHRLASIGGDRTVRVWDAIPVAERADWANRYRAEKRAVESLELARKGDHTRAVAQGSLAEKEDLSGPALYYLSAASALASTAVRKDDRLPEPERARLAEQYAGHAVELLARARGLGMFLNRQFLRSLKDDPDLTPVRARADFRKLLSELEVTAKPESHPPRSGSELGSSLDNIGRLLASAGRVAELGKEKASLKSARSAEDHGRAVNCGAPMTGQSASAFPPGPRQGSCK